MPNTPKDFKNDLARFEEKLDKVIVDVQRGITTVTRNRVAAKTPIATGRAAASWNASVRLPNTQAKPEGYNNPANAPFAGMISYAGMKVGDSTYVSNSVPYIEDLNAGSSVQAPAAFVETTATEINATMRIIIGNSRARIRI